MTLQLTDFIDIHTHILPGVDDGPKTLEDSVALAKWYVDLGIQQIIATPHFIPGTAWAASKQLLLEKIDDLQKYLQANGISLAIFPGMEIAFHKRFRDRLEGKTVLPLANSAWYLLEPSFTDSADELLYCLDRLVEQGWNIILAHPERIPALQQLANPFTELVRHGLRLQINIGSLLGKFGTESKRVGLDFIDRGYVQYLASDAHGVDARRPPTAEEWLELEKIVGDDALHLLCCNNPAQLLLEKH